MDTKNLGEQSVAIVACKKKTKKTVVLPSSLSIVMVFKAHLKQPKYCIIEYSATVELHYTAIPYQFSVMQ